MKTELRTAGQGLVCSREEPAHPHDSAPLPRGLAQAHPDLHPEAGHQFLMTDVVVANFSNPQKIRRWMCS